MSQQYPQDQYPSNQYAPQYPPQYQSQPHQPPHQPYVPPPVAAPPAQKPEKKGNALVGCLTLVILVVIVIGVIAVVTSGGGGDSFKARVGSYTVINPADLAVAVHVTNTGKTAATPTCTVNAQDPSGAYSGVDAATLDSPVRPGQTVTYVDNVTITGQGASYVTQVTVSC